MTKKDSSQQVVTNTPKNNNNIPDSFVTPSFIHKKETPQQADNSLQNDMKKTMEQDIQTFISQFDNVRDKKDRIEICKS